MESKRFNFYLFFLFLALPIELSYAKLVQILHTNDTHSFLDNATHSQIQGGAARLKGIIDFYKEKMNEEGIPSLVMDAGDFSEGNLYYMADSGRKSFEVENNIGFDFVTIGNHDYLMGTRELDTILGEMDLKFSFLAANISVSSQFPNIRAKIKPYKEIEIDGIKLAVLGLTTNEIFYKWRLNGGKITNPFSAASHYEDELKKRENDFIIALTHIGYKNDIKLAKRTKNIDLIVGGHSHTTLHEPTFKANQRNRLVPIVQAGMHTEHLGRMIIDIEKGQPLKVVHYELIPITDDFADESMDNLVAEADENLNQTYGKDWLDEVVGHSDLKPLDEHGQKKWAYFVTDTLKEKSGADIGIHTPSMNGENYPVGKISRRDLFNSIPRVLELSEKYGWNIYTTKIRGIWIKILFEALAHFGEPLTFSGIKMDYVKTEHGIKIKRLLVNGKKLNPFKLYTVAFTEGIVRGAKAISPYTTLLLKDPRDTQHKIWFSLEDRLKNNIGKLSMSEIDEDNRTLVMPNEDASLPE